MSAAAVIPARLGSTRLPRKVLADLAGRPLLWHVWRRVCGAGRVARVVVVTDSPEVVAAAEGWGATALLTPADCPSGTDRVAAALDRVPGEPVLNVQGDEPFLNPLVLDAVVDGWERSGADVVTPVFPIRGDADLTNPAVVKVVRSASGRALYFSRSPVPHLRDVPAGAWAGQTRAWGHLGVYGFSRAALRAFPALPVGPLEAAERLEQLRFLENDLSVLTVEVDAYPAAVDTPADLDRARQFLAAHPGMPAAADGRRGDGA